MNDRSSGSGTGRRTYSGKGSRGTYAKSQTYKNGKLVSSTPVSGGKGGHYAKGTTASGPKPYKAPKSTSGGHNVKGTTASGPKRNKKNPAYGHGGHYAKGSGSSGNYSQRGKSKLQKGLESLEENARKIKMNKDVPSTRPDERTGRERANHKYIDKVRTKSGKIRYIYDIDTASGKQRNANDVHAANLKRRQQNARKNLQGTYKGQELRNKQTKFGNSPLGRIKGMADQAMKNVRSLPSKAISAGSNFIKSLFR